MKLPYLKNGNRAVYNNLLERMHELYDFEVLEKSYYHRDLQWEYPQGTLMFWVEGQLEPAEFDVMYDILDWQGELTDEQPAKEMYDPRDDRAYELLIDRRLGIA